MSDVRPGYKRSEVGVIPEDWEAVPLGKLASFKTGPFGSSIHKADYVEEGTPLINPMHIIDGKIVPAVGTTISQDKAEVLRDFRLTPGDVVIGRRGDMGRCAVVLTAHDGWICGTGSMVVRPNQITDPRYLQRFLSSRDAVLAIEATSVGSTMINLNQATLSGLWFRYPPLAEQRAIAEALGDEDGLIGGLEALIAKKRDIKQGAMQELLTGQRRLPGFYEPWAIEKLGSVVTIRNDKVQTRDNPVAKVCVELEQVVSGAGALERIEDARERTSIKYRFQQGDVLFGRLRPYLRKYWIADREGVCSTEIWPLVSGRGQVDQGLLFYIVQTDDFVATASAAYGTHMPRADWKMMASFQFKLAPTSDEQRAIAAVLSDLDAEIAALAAKLAKARAVKQGMMQVLLTGEIRLI